MATEILASWAVAVELRAPGGETAGLVGLDQAFCDALIERAFGAPVAETKASSPASVSPVTPQKMTALGLKTIQPTLHGVVSDLGIALGGKTPIRLTAGEPTPGEAMELPRALLSLFVSRLEVIFGAYRCSVTVALLPTIVELSCRRGTVRSAEPAPMSIARNLQSALVEVSACLGQTQLTMAELLALRPGDLIRLERGRTERVPVSVEGVTKFLGQPTQCGGAFGVTIETDMT